MFIITKTFTDDEGHLYTKVNPKQYSTPEEAYDAMREDYLNELKSRGLEDNGSSNDDGESCPGGYIISDEAQIYDFAQYTPYEQLLPAVLFGVHTECLNLAKSIDAIILCYNPDIDALKAENLSDMAVRLLDGVSRRDVVKDLEDFRDKWRHYNEKTAAESQVILDKISELFEKDGDSK